MQDSEERDAIGLPVSLEVKITHASFGTLILKTATISDSGVYLYTQGHQMPELGTKVQVQLNGTLGDGEEPPVLDMLIDRKDANGIGLSYIKLDTRSARPN